MKQWLILLVLMLTACSSTPERAPRLRLLADTASREAVALATQQQWVQAQAAWREALTGYQAIDDWHGQGRASLGLAAVLLRQAGQTQAKVHLQYLIDQAAFPASQRAQAAYQMALLETSPEWLVRARTLCGERCALAVQLDNFEAAQALRAGEWDRASQLAERALKAAAHLPAEESHARRLLAEVAMQQQDWLRARQELDAVLVLDRKLAEPCWLLDDYVLLARWAAARGDLLLGKEAEMRQKSIRAGLGEQACLAVAGALR